MLIYDFTTFCYKTDNAVSASPGPNSIRGRFCEGKNTKLGEDMFTYDMQPLASCPGCRHALCKELRPDCKAAEKPICFGFRDRYRQERMKDRLAINFAFSKSPQFVPWAIDTLTRRRNAKAVRLPGIGDMHDPAFVEKVRSIVRANPHLWFWAYTRSSWIPEIWEALKSLKCEPNMSLWLSWDRMMAAHYGPPPDRELPWCWLAENDDDLPPEPVAIVWRFNSQLSGHVTLPKKHVLGDSLVCPHETGVASKVTCGTCQICWRGEKFRTAKIAKLLEKYKE